MYSSPITSKKGFSILIALGSIGVLMIIVIGMVQVFLTEMRLSRYQYDYILANEQVEGAFEYAMLKVGNHRDGFQDEVTESDLDQILFSGATDRTTNNKITYHIYAQTGNLRETILPGDYLIFPLFSGDDDYIVSGKPSKIPNINTGSTIVDNFRMSLSMTPENIYWSIIAMSGSQNVSLSGTGEINGTEKGLSRLIGVECIDNAGNSVAPIDNSCPPAIISAGGEALQYFFDQESTVEDFLKVHGVGVNARQVQDPYFLVFNKGANPVNLLIQSNASTPFALQNLTIVVEAKKGKAIQTIRFNSDKSKYYDGLKYSLYDTQ
ncbi:MAG: hypothetical protein HHAS10_04140 [Candidatus Altimarinota bacterium]